MPRAELHKRFPPCQRGCRRSVHVMPCTAAPAASNSRSLYCPGYIQELRRKVGKCRLQQSAVDKQVNATGEEVHALELEREDLEAVHACLQSQLAAAQARRSDLQVRLLDWGALHVALSLAHLVLPRL